MPWYYQTNREYSSLDQEFKVTTDYGRSAVVLKDVPKTAKINEHIYNRAGRWRPDVVVDVVIFSQSGNAYNQSHFAYIRTCWLLSSMNFETKRVGQLRHLVGSPLQSCSIKQAREASLRGEHPMSSSGRCDRH